MLYLDVILILLAAAPVVLLGAPAFGYAVGGGAWILGRIASAPAERRIAAMEGVRRKLGYGLGFSMARIWVMAGAIVLAGVAGSRANGLTAALVIFAAFSIYFVRTAFGHITATPRSTTR
ncbi:MAG TPA: hypothetical protein VHZ31_08285 [Solirubrobacteraceae bacterium]|nr:hypothetical protein [Solirubrobacteraceae bacterium]